MSSHQVGETKPNAGFPRRTCLVAAAVLALHLVVAYALDAAGLIESLLSPSGTRVLWILPLAILLYLLRFAAYFVVPGLVVGSLLVWIAGNRRIQDH